jgi:hypothetical protein
MKETELKCYRCKNALEDEEIETTFTDDKGNRVCNTCYKEYYSFQCCLCDDLVDLSEWNHFIIPDSSYGFDPGLYKIIARPFFISNIIGEDTIFPSSVERVADIPLNFHAEEYVTTEVCDNCAHSATRRVSKKVR